MKSLVAALATLLACALTAAAPDPARFAGEWKSTFGPVQIKQDGDAASGTIGLGKFPFKGTIKGKDLSLAYDEGQAHVEATFTLDPSGNAFGGTFQVKNGRRGVWNGWRPDSAASRGKPADFSGLWLTEL